MSFLTLFTTGLILFAGGDHPKSAAGYFNLGNTLFLEGKLPEAIVALKRGHDLDPNDAVFADDLAEGRRGDGGN